MTNYQFQTNEFGISNDGIHLLRSGFNYETIGFSEISKIKIERGREIHNWFLVFIIGAVLIIGGVYLSIQTIKILIEGNVAPRNARMIFILLIPVVGGLFVYNALQTGTVLKIEYSNGKKDMFPLRIISKEKKLNEFKAFLRD